MISCGALFSRAVLCKGVSTHICAPRMPIGIASTLGSPSSVPNVLIINNKLILSTRTRTRSFVFGSFDFFHIVYPGGLDLLTMGESGSSFVSVVRVVRVLRPLRFITRFPKLRKLTAVCDDDALR